MSPATGNKAAHRKPSSWSSDKLGIEKNKTEKTKTKPLFNSHESDPSFNPIHMLIPIHMSLIHIRIKRIRPNKQNLYLL
jgi:hypothetical protein